MIVLALVPLLIALVIAAIVYRAIMGMRLASEFRARWHPEGRFVLFVHSNSPVWKEHVERNILPRIAHRCVLLNWSERNQWRNGMPLEAKMLRHWGGVREFNPMAIVVAPRGKVRTIRMFKAFRDFKHGRLATLRKHEDELFSIIAMTEQQFIGPFIAPRRESEADGMQQRPRR